MNMVVALTWCRYFCLVDRNNAGKDARTHPGNESADEEHCHVNGTGTEGATDNENDRSYLHRTLAAILVGRPSLGKATCDCAGGVDPVQGPDHVGGVVIAGLSCHGEIEVRVEVRLPDGRPDNGKSIGRGNRAYGHEDDHP
jgi:hypothetical protein